MKGILNTILLVPGDKIYVVVDRQNKVVAQSKVIKVVVTEDYIQYQAYMGKIVCVKDGTEYKKGEIVHIRYLNFFNSNIDTGKGLINPVYGNEENQIFTTKEKCIKFLKGE